MEEIKTRRGFVYYIAADSDPKKRLYIGSSLKTPEDRKAKHKHAKGKRNTSADVIMSQFDDWDLHIIEWYELTGTKLSAFQELRQHEQQWIDIMREDCVNENNADGHDKQKRKANARKYNQSEKGKVYAKRNNHKMYSKNKERYLAQQKEYNRAHREEISARNKARYERNKADVRLKQAQYRLANREYINARKREIGLANLDHIRAQRRASYKRHSETILAKRREERKKKREASMDED